MEYFRTLNFEQEPFSNSPDPNLFFNSKQHLEALQKLEISIRLKRGLNVITGDVGTGKTTLSRQLIQKISHEPDIKYFLILDPGFNSTTDFLSYILYQFTGIEIKQDETQIKEQIKKYLFAQGVDSQKIIVLLIDEGQKLPVFCLEVLRELLNYETNDTKLLQIVIFAQKEFNNSLATLDNFNDRINFRYALSPLGFAETKALIKFRLDKSSEYRTDIPQFSYFAFLSIFRYTKGYPRKIINLCHHIMLGLIISKKNNVDFFFVKSCAREVLKPFKKQGIRFTYLAVAGCVIIASANVIDFKNLISIMDRSKPEIYSPVEITVKKVIKNKTVAMPVVEATKNFPAKISVPENIVPVIVPTSVIKTPRFYGSLRVPQDETLYNMIEAVYGSVKKEYMGKLLEVNTNIKDPNRINAGMLLYFPIISTIDHFRNNNQICIVFSKESQFENAYATIRKLKKLDFDVKLLPGWNQQDGFLFSIVANKIFDSLTEANKYKNNFNGINNLVCEKISSFNHGRKIL